MFGKLRNSLELSLKRQSIISDHSIILNPVESTPAYAGDKDGPNFLQGFYVSDKIRSKFDPGKSKILFAGRKRGTYDTHKICTSWANALGGATASLRLLSGLHAHISIFMGLGQIGDSILLLPEEAGGHMATASILDRLGYRIIYMKIDFKNFRIDIGETKKLIKDEKPKFIFVDRSEGLVYEDFSEIIDNSKCYAIYDASQYLPGILSGFYKNPFKMGFDLVISTLHKSFPGPQKALVVSKYNDGNWQRILSGLGTFVSSSHIRNTYLSAFAFENFEELEQYSKEVVKNAVALEQILAHLGLPIIRRPDDSLATHHLWIQIPDRLRAFELYRILEKIRVLTNYRLLPYDLGFGLRLGTCAATRKGLDYRDFEVLGECISVAYHHGFTLRTRHRVRDICAKVNLKKSSRRSI